MSDESPLTEGEFNEMMGYRPEDSQVVFDALGSNPAMGALGPYVWFADGLHLRTSMPLEDMQFGDVRVLFLALGHALESVCKGMGTTAETRV